MKHAFPASERPIPVELDLIANAGSHLRALYAKLTTRDIAAATLAGGAIAWLTINRYLSLFYLPGIEAGEVGLQVFLVCLIPFWMLTLAVLFFVFLAPRYEELLTAAQKPKWISPLRVGGIALLSFAPQFLCQWSMLLAWPAAIAVLDAALWSRSNPEQPIPHAIAYALLQLLGSLVTVLWLGFVHIAWFSLMLTLGVEIAWQWPAAVAGAAIATAFHWLIGRDAQPAIAGAMLLLAGVLLFSNPGIAGLVAAGFQILNIGGGAGDIAASGDGTLLCDMGVLNRHFYVRPAKGVCDDKAAITMLHELRQQDGAKRAEWLAAHRISVPVDHSKPENTGASRPASAGALKE